MKSEHGGEKYKRIGLNVVLDTNVYVSMFNRPAGLLAEVWWHAKKGTYRLIVSPAIVREFAGVSRRDFGWDERKVRFHVRLINKIGKLVTPHIIPNVIPEDPPDNHIFACAVAGKANLIVSNDRDLLRRKSYEGIGIVTPVDFIHMLE